jgi:hypothetical protein
MVVLTYVIIAAIPLTILLHQLWRLRSRLVNLREGDAPHCERCGYNLTGLTSGRCPECGSLLETMEIQRGLPVISRRVLLALTLMFLVFVVLALVAAIYGR